jgi:sortase B
MHGYSPFVTRRVKKWSHHGTRFISVYFEGITMRRFFLALTLLVFIVSWSGYIYYYMQYYSSRLEYSQAAGRNVKAEGGKVAIDFPSLTKINNDIIAWITVEGTNINYPVVQGKDNAYYLKHSYNRKPSITGSIFMDYQNKSDFSDSNTLIYGHNMRDGSMFQELEKYNDQEFFIKNKYIKVYTAHGNLVYEVFSAYTAKQADGLYDVGTMNTREMKAYLDKISQLALLKRDIGQKDGLKLLTLVTCDYGYKDARMFVHAKKVEENKSTFAP